jgi:hypothetical protein
MADAAGPAVTVTVPPVPDGASPYKSYRKVVDGIDGTLRGGHAVLGTFADPGATIAVAAGSLLLAVDQALVRWDHAHGTGERYPVMSADVTLHLADGDGLRQLWRRSFARARSASGPAALAQLRRHLAAHPPPGAQVTVIGEGPGAANLNDAPCAWCGTRVPKEQGRVHGRGETARVTHAPGRCPARPAADGDACELCGITMAARRGSRRVITQAGSARWITAHHEHLACTTRPQPSWEQEQEEARQHRELQRTAAAAGEKNAAARRRQERDRAARQAAGAEQARAAALTRVSREACQLYDKGLGAGWRARLSECTDGLSDETTATCWTVESYPQGAHATMTADGDAGGDLPAVGQEEYWHLPDARAAYRRLRYQPGRDTAPAAGGPEDRAVGCPGPDVPHCDNCGALAPAAGSWMTASLGRACDTSCYDAMADAQGAHSRRHHGLHGRSPATRGQLQASRTPGPHAAGMS